MRITFIGGGNMASALIGGLLADPSACDLELAVVEPSSEQREALAGRGWPLAIHQAPSAQALACDVLIVAVKPQQMRRAVEALKPWLMTDQVLVISVAAGIRARDLSRWLGGYRRIVRSMPNTPALIGRGVSGVTQFDPSRAEDRGVAERILAAVGEVVWVDDESLLDAVTAVSGSGPAYVFRMMEAIEAGGVSLGLQAEQARRLTLATFAGAAELALRSNDPPSTLRERVTSKGGTTAAALALMEERGLSTLVHDALMAAARRSGELGDEFGAS